MSSETHTHGGGKDHEFSIMVNGRPRTVTSNELSFDEVVELAYPGGPRGDNWVYTVGYRRAEGNKSGSVSEGDTVKVKDGLVLDVTQTDKS
jgi:hypothetical protein